MSEKSQNTDFEFFEKLTKKYFLELEQNVLHIQQTLFDLQNEYYKLWKNHVLSQISLQKEFFIKSGFNYSLPNTTKDMIENTSVQTIHLSSIFHKMIITNIEQGKNYVKTFNENLEIFVNLNRKMIQNWISVFNSNQNN